jgi:hypothetical protein
MAAFSGVEESERFLGQESARGTELVRAADPADDVEHHVGGTGVERDVDRAVGTDPGDDEVGDRLAGLEVQVRGNGAWTAPRVDREEARAGGARHGDVERYGRHEATTLRHTGRPGHLDP